MNNESSQLNQDSGEPSRAFFESNAVCTNPRSPVGLSVIGSDKLLEATSTELAISLDGPAVG